MHGPKDRKWYHDPNYTFKTVRDSVLFGGLAVGVVAIVLLCCGIAAITSTAGCSDKGSAYGVRTTYSFWANTCYAHLPHQTVNIDQLHQNVKGQIIYLKGVKP